MGEAMGDGKRFLEGLILRAEDVLGKMIFKMHHTEVPLEEMVPWINSVYAFVNAWEAPLQDIKIDQLKRDAAASSRRHAEDALIEEMNQQLDCGRSKTIFEEEEEDNNKPQPRGAVVRLEEAEPVFDFLERSLKDYKVNQTGRCVISCQGTASRSFCMVDRDDPDCTKLIAALQNCHGVKLAQLPRADQVFGVYLDGSLFRAVRNKLVEDSTLKFAYVRLLDTGEIIQYKEDMILCSLSEYYQKLPAFAIRCILVNILDDPFCDDLDQYLKNALHTDQHYKVVSVEGPILFLKLSQQPILLANKSLRASRTDSSTDTTPTKPVRVKPKKNKPLHSRMAFFKPDQLELSNNSHSIRMPTASVTKEAESACPFSNSATSNCAKGAHSKHEAVPVTPPSSSPETPTEEPYRFFQNDTSDVTASSAAGAGGGDKQQDQLIVPPIGSMVYLVVKFIKDVEHFWCHVVSADSSDTDLMELELKLNSPEYTMHYRKLKQPPEFCQRVFAKYTDRRWYRAEVATYFDPQNVLVFYVDYGNAELVRMDHIREWDENFSYLPYQAVFCRLANVCRVRPHHKQAVVEMNRTLLNQRVLAKIENNQTPWEISIYDKDGFDFSVALLMAGLAKKRVDKAPNSSDSSRAEKSDIDDNEDDVDDDDDEMRIPVIGPA
ncbi:uncharacterized protein LOC129717590 isoform X1 [Wyeomyia smithii]|uniref:uncharacterized protein LOC129717590 isoform X1 n=1 Tax=Wyeomyia smithii TaxID=174621 RepID=UPI0024681BB0|nr:uncharacterized protein LOC129717590 isoform X1 [Wyeomyia smithii]